MSCDGDNEYILITKKCQQLFLFFLIFFLIFYFSLYLVILHEDRFLIFLILFVLFVLFLLFVLFFIYFFLKPYMAAAELAALRQGEPRGGMEGPAEAVPERVTERNVSEAE